MKTKCCCFVRHRWRHLCALFTFLQTVTSLMVLKKYLALCFQKFLVLLGYFHTVEYTYQCECEQVNCFVSAQDAQHGSEFSPFLFLYMRNGCCMPIGQSTRTRASPQNTLLFTKCLEFFAQKTRVDPVTICKK